MSNQVIQIHDVEIKTGITIADRYEIRGHLGAGGFAQVFEAFDTNIERPVAIKFLNLHASQTSTDASANILARFKREAKLAARIQHPNVVNIFDFGVIGHHKNIPYIVMEMLSGHDLEEQIFEVGPMKPDRALPLFIACLEALGVAHQAGIVHKDLKPSNLFLSNPGERTEALRIVDFGIAHIRSPQEGRLTATGEILGTPQYLPPEYIESQLVTPAYDVYQMGLILVEALTGRPVVDDNHPLRCVKTHSLGELDLPQPLLESPLGMIIARALHLDHAQRFSDAEAFADALSKIDPASVPVLGPDTPTARLTEAGTLDSDSHLMNSQTGQMRQPSTGQLTQQGYAQPSEESWAGRTKPTFDASAASTGPAPTGPAATGPMENSTQAAISQAGIGKNGVKALVLLVLAVLVLGGVAGWLLITRLDDEEASTDEAAVVEATEQTDDEEPADDNEPAAGADKSEPAELAAAVDEGEKQEDDAPPAEKPEPVEVMLVSSPEGALVQRGSEELGTAPVSIEFASADDEPVELKFTHRGYKPETLTVGPDAGSEVRVELTRKKKRTTRRTKRKAKKAASPKQAKTDTSSSSSSRKEKEPVDRDEKVEKKKERQRMLIAP